MGLVNKLSRKTWISLPACWPPYSRSLRELVLRFSCFYLLPGTGWSLDCYPAYSHFLPERLELWVSSSAWWILVKLQLLCRFGCSCHLSHTWKDPLPVGQVDFKPPFSVSCAFTDLLKSCSSCCKLFRAVIKHRGLQRGFKIPGLGMGRCREI